MKIRTLLFALLSFFSSTLFAQSGIHQQTAINEDNSDADLSAMLDVKSLDKGLLIPRVAISDLATADPVTNPAPSLLVYNEDTNTGPGFFYWDGTTWTPVGKQVLSLSGTTLTISNGNSIDLVTIDTNTDEQTLGLSGNNLQISNGNTVDLSPINSDQQTMSLSGTDLSISNGNTVDLAIIDTNTDEQTLGLSGNNLQISNGNTVDLSPINSDQQTMSLSGTDLSISNGNTVDLAIIDTNTDEQTLSFTSPTLTISNGNSINIAPSEVVDGDQDTKVIANEDFISIQVDGTEHIRFEEERMEFLNTGNSIFIGKNAGQEDDLTGNENVFIGNSAGSKNTTGEDNIALGLSALLNNESGFSNVSIGRISSFSNVDGSYNISIGDNSLRQNVSGNHNIAFGDNSFNKLLGSFNTGIGSNAGFNLQNGGGNIFFGNNAGYAASAYSASLNIVIGEGAAYQIQTGSDENVIIGPQAGYSLSGDRNIFLGFQAGYNEISSNKLYIENTDADPNEALIYGDMTPSSEMLRVNGSFEVSLVGSATNTFKVDNTGAVSINEAYTLPNADGIDSQVLTTDGSGNVSWADGGGGANQTLSLTGTDLMISGGNTVDLINIDTDTDQQTMTLSGATLTISNGNSVNIAQAEIVDGDQDTKVTANEDFVSVQIDGTEHIRFEKNRIEFLNTGQSVFIGEDAGANDDGTNNNNVFIGFESGLGNDDGNHNIGVGYRTLRSNTGGDKNIAVGFNAMDDNTSGKNNIAFGSRTLWSNIDGNDNVSIGFESMFDNENGDDNISMGYRSMFENLSSNNISIGAFSLYSNQSGGNNVIIGIESGRNNLGSENIFIGYQSGKNQPGSNKLYIENTDADPNEALIYGDMTPSSEMLRVNGSFEVSLVGSATNTFKVDNTGAVSINEAYTLPNADGTASQVLTTDGSGNVSWANGGGGANQTLSLTGTDLMISGGNTIDLSPINTDAQTLSMVDANTLGISGGNTVDLSNVGADEQMLSFSSPNLSISNGNSVDIVLSEIIDGDLDTKVIAGEDFVSVEVDGSEQLRFENDKAEFSTMKVGINREAVTNTFEVNGEASKSSAGDWLANSDARLKKHIQPLDSQGSLKRLLQLQGVTYEWNDQQTGYERPTGIQYGFTAQNIQKVFPTFVSPDGQGYLQTAYGTYDALTVEAIRALQEQIQALQLENASLKAQIDEIHELKAQVKQIQTLLQTSEQVTRPVFSEKD